MTEDIRMKEVRSDDRTSLLINRFYNCFYFYNRQDITLHHKAHIFIMVGHAINTFSLVGRSMIMRTGIQREKLLQRIPVSAQRLRQIIGNDNLQIRP